MCRLIAGSPNAAAAQPRTIIEHNYRSFIFARALGSLAGIGHDEETVPRGKPVVVEGRTLHVLVARPVRARRRRVPSRDGAGRVRVDGDRERAWLALAAVGLEWAADRHPRDLSSGERERLGLAAVTVASPDLLVLDEPTRGVDPDRKAALADWLGAQGRRARIVSTSFASILHPTDSTSGR